MLYCCHLLSFASRCLCGLSVIQVTVVTQRFLIAHFQINAHMVSRSVLPSIIVLFSLDYANFFIYCKKSLFIYFRKSQPGNVTYQFPEGSNHKILIGKQMIHQVYHLFSSKRDQNFH